MEAERWARGCPAQGWVELRRWRGVVAAGSEMGSSYVYSGR
jgi:hypothetical protein